jgi:hypothetical protein
MVHIEEVKKVQHFIESDPVSLNIIWTGGILRDQCADDGEDGKENEERDGEFERTEKVKEYDEDSFLLLPDRDLRFFHRVLSHEK